MGILQIFPEYCPEPISKLWGLSALCTVVELLALAPNATWNPKKPCFIPLLSYCFRQLQVGQYPEPSVSMSDLMDTLSVMRSRGSSFAEFLPTV